MNYPELDRDELFLVYLFGIELDRRCRQLTHASQLMKRAVRRADAQEAFFYLESLLGSAAAISRIFWPPGWNQSTTTTYASRARLLRKNFRMTSRSVFYARGVRNAFEHFDERLDDFLAAGETVVVDANIGPPGSIVGKGIRLLRNLDQTTWTASYLDETANLPRLVNAANTFRREKLVGVTPMLDTHMRPRNPRR